MAKGYGRNAVFRLKKFLSPFSNGGFPNSNIYVTTAETVEEALTSFEEYSRFYGSIQALDL
jgi:hypothetical protein